MIGNVNNTSAIYIIQTYLVDFDWNTSTIVFNTDLPLLTINNNLDNFHRCVTLLVIRSID